MANFPHLGNHDYGDWRVEFSAGKKGAKHPQLEKLSKPEAGFKLPGKHYFRKMEKNLSFRRRNWGNRPFPQCVDLDKALKGVPEDTLKF